MPNFGYYHVEILEYWGMVQVLTIYELIGGKNMSRVVHKLKGHQNPFRIGGFPLTNSSKNGERVKLRRHI